MDEREDGERDEADSVDEAELETHATTGGAAAAGALTAGLIGAAGAGPIGAAVGALGGALIGAASERIMHAEGREPLVEPALADLEVADEED
jgi:hypothetical protein